MHIQAAVQDQIVEGTVDCAQPQVVPKVTAGKTSIALSLGSILKDACLRWVMHAATVITRAGRELTQREGQMNGMCMSRTGPREGGFFKENAQSWERVKEEAEGKSQRNGALLRAETHFEREEWTAHCNRDRRKCERKKFHTQQGWKSIHKFPYMVSSSRPEKASGSTVVM